MKIEEAVVVLKQFKEESQKHKDNYTPIGTSNLSPVLKIMQDTYQDNIDAFDMAIEALEKQTPMPTRLECDGPEQWLVCPSCGDTGVEDERPYCKECGQKIDWSEFQEV